MVRPCHGMSLSQTLTPATMRMDPEDLMLRERSQLRKDKYYTILSFFIF